MQPLAAQRRIVGLAFVAGPIGALAVWVMRDAGAWPGGWSAPSSRDALLMLLVAPLVEEFAFRGALQDFCRTALCSLSVRDSGLLTASNLLTSLAFAACHLRDHSMIVAWAVLFPSLLLGHVKEVSNSMGFCVMLHAWFNLCFLAVALLSSR